MSRNRTNNVSVETRRRRLQLRVALVRFPVAVVVYLLAELLITNATDVRFVYVYTRVSV